MRSRSLTTELASILRRPVDERTRERAAWHVLDWLGCAFAGTPTPEGQALLRWANRFAEPGNFPVVGAATRSREAAVLVNGGLGNILEMDDLHRTAILHPGPVVIPAAMAAAFNQDLTGAQFLDGVVRGYEAMVRIGQSFGSGHYRYWHNTATAGPFGAAAAVCSILNASADEVVHALGHAGTQSAGLWQTRHEPSMSKQLHTGRAAHSGLVAAELAVSGFTAPTEILEGPQGFYAAMCPDPLPELVVSQSGADWLIHEVSFKPWPACRHAHAAIDAALMLRAQRKPEDVQDITVETYDEAVRFCDRPMPNSVAQARFSLQHAVAVSLIRGEPALADFEPESFNDPVIRALCERVQVGVDAAIDSRFPHRYGAALNVTLRNGESIRIESPDALGDPNKPVSEARRVAKAHALMSEGGLATTTAGQLASCVSALPGSSSLQSLWTMLSAAGNSNVLEARQ